MQMDHSRETPQFVEGIKLVIQEVQKPRPRFLQNPGAADFYLPHSPFHSSPEVSEPGDESLFDDFFDWTLWREDQVINAPSRSKSDSPSMPGLTSGTTPPPSEKDGATSPPREKEDYSQYRSQLKEAKKTDDGYTFPQQRELRPKNNSAYHLHISVNNAHSAGASINGYNSESTLLSPPSSPRSSSDGSQLNNPYLARGKRNGPLKNGDEVAEVRAVGACVCCRVRKVKCDEKDVCGKCTEKAPKYKCGSGSILGRHICFRNPFAESQLLFPQIAKTDTGRFPSLIASRPAPGDKVGTLNVYFRPAMNDSIPQNPLRLHVVMKASSLVPGQEFDASNCNLHIDHQPNYVDLRQWAQQHMVNIGSTDFQSTLDNFVLEYTHTPIRAPGKHVALPKCDLLNKIHEMRCLYKIWSQKEFVYQYESGGPMHVLGKLLQTGLRNLAKFELRRLEQDVFALLEKSLVNPKQKDALQDDDQMAVWAAVLQLILMYYDLFGKTVSVNTMPPNHAYYRSAHQLRNISKKLFSALVVICEASFGKKELAFKVDSRQGEHQCRVKERMNAVLKQVEARRDEYIDSLDPKLNQLNVLLSVLRPKTTKKGHSAKRQKTSR
ncbi:hypothetical protein PFICI_01510 [Pestalotiopsis fici W106-1]|uniref:Zn(2)-C6 fungal-type domain-containing protein n=1 Tax=Pestalotiopsis fici (strain W106-1 / CGMCC3.15140) TaxID=1229662 RepID=W3XQ99_PESFW|nr:uncharacterized protein PFICI_01510 [Pestalotiopsis fici W106-1]ETS87682.1 hypothetical protein PFICI_01510 [Pestalotiopsis fici W106-1]